jgi:hypothetical protein
MGYIRHDAIIVTGWEDVVVEAAAAMAGELGLLVIGPSVATMNYYRTFLVCPDGSKEGWNQSDDFDAKRAEFLRYLNSVRNEDYSNLLEWAAVSYGSDDGEAKVVAHAWDKPKLTDNPARVMAQMIRDRGGHVPKEVEEDLAAFCDEPVRVTSNERFVPVDEAEAMALTSREYAERVAARVARAQRPAAWRSADWTCATAETRSIDSFLVDPAKEEALNPWKVAVLDALVVNWAYKKEHDDDPRMAVHDCIAREVEIALDPQVSSEARALVERGAAPVPDPVANVTLSGDAEYWKAEAERRAATTAMWFDRLVELETEYHKLQALVSAQGIRLMEAEDAPAVPPELAEAAQEMLDEFENEGNLQEGAMIWYGTMGAAVTIAALKFCAGRKQQ